MTAVKNQGQCGGCWAFATTGALEGATFVHSKVLTSLSEQEFLDCDRDFDNGCNGGNPVSAIQWAVSHGVCTESEDPFKAHDEACQVQPNSGCSGLANGCVTGALSCSQQDGCTEQGLMEAVAQQPVAVAIDGSKIQAYTSGVYTTLGGPTTLDNLDHAVLLVGYGTAKDGTPYWKLKNSWTSDWGDDGYFRLLRGADPSVAGTGGTLGLLFMPVWARISSDCVPGSNSLPLWAQLKTLMGKFWFWLIVLLGAGICFWGLGVCCCSKRLPSVASSWPSARRSAASQPLNQPQVVQPQPAQQRGPVIRDGQIVYA